jgi:hypothetical protein
VTSDAGKPTEAWISEYMKHPPPTRSELMFDLIDAANRLSKSNAENASLRELLRRALVAINNRAPSTCLEHEIRRVLE